LPAVPVTQKAPKLVQKPVVNKVARTIFYSARNFNRCII